MRAARPINWIQWVTLITLLCVAVTVPIIFVRLNNVANNQNKALRTVLCFFQARTLANPKLPESQKQQTVVVFGEALSLIREHRC